MPDQRIIVQTETEVRGGWEFEITLEQNPAGPAPDRRRLLLLLTWTDYERWSRGTVSPHQIAREIVEFLLQHNELDNQPDRLDAARLRRRIPNLDAKLTPSKTPRPL